jgi:hypothetical protein
MGEKGQTQYYRDIYHFNFMTKLGFQSVVLLSAIVVLLDFSRENIQESMKN